MIYIDLTGGEAKVVGNRGDTHLFRLNNPVGQDIINADGEYEGEFSSYLGGEPIGFSLDTSEVANGILQFPVTIASGTYKIRRLNPRRTILTIEVEAQ